MCWEILNILKQHKYKAQVLQQFEKCVEEEKRKLNDSDGGMENRVNSIITCILNSSVDFKDTYLKGRS